MGGLVNAVTKSGSTEFHGSGFYFFRRARASNDDQTVLRGGETTPA